MKSFLAIILAISWTISYHFEVWGTESGRTVPLKDRSDNVPVAVGLEDSEPKYSTSFSREFATSPFHMVVSEFQHSNHRVRFFFASLSVIHHFTRLLGDSLKALPDQQFKSPAQVEDEVLSNTEKRVWGQYREFVTNLNKFGDVFPQKSDVSQDRQTATNNQFKRAFEKYLGEELMKNNPPSEKEQTTDAGDANKIAGTRMAEFMHPFVAVFFANPKFPVVTFAVNQFRGGYVFRKIEVAPGKFLFWPIDVRVSGTANNLYQNLRFNQQNFNFKYAREVYRKKVAPGDVVAVLNTGIRQAMLLPFIALAVNLMAVTPLDWNAIEEKLEANEPIENLPEGFKLFKQRFDKLWKNQAKLLRNRNSQLKSFMCATNHQTKVDTAAPPAQDFLGCDAQQDLLKSFDQKDVSLNVAASGKAKQVVDPEEGQLGKCFHEEKLLRKMRNYVVSQDENWKGFINHNYLQLFPVHPLLKALFEHPFEDARTEGAYVVHGKLLSKLLAEKAAELLADGQVVDRKRTAGPCKRLVQGTPAGLVYSTGTCRHFDHHYAAWQQNDILPERFMRRNLTAVMAQVAHNPNFPTGWDDQIKKKVDTDPQFALLQKSIDVATKKVNSLDEDTKHFMAKFAKAITQGLIDPSDDEIRARRLEEDDRPVTRDAERLAGASDPMDQEHLAPTPHVKHVNGKFEFEGLGKVEQFSFESN